MADGPTVSVEVGTSPPPPERSPGDPTLPFTGASVLVLLLLALVLLLAGWRLLRRHAPRQTRPTSVAAAADTTSTGGTTP